VTEPQRSSSAGSTGHQAVDSALVVLDRLDELAPTEWIAVYETVHRSLRETLATIDEG